jgi:hypothetical protein
MIITISFSACTGLDWADAQSKQTQNKKARHDGGLVEFVRAANSTCPPVQKPGVGQEVKEKSEALLILDG